MLVRQARAVLDFNWTGKYTKPGALSPYDTLTVGESSVPIGEPDRCLPRDRGRYHVAAFELAVAYLISGSFKLGDYPATAGVDREPPVLGPVRGKDTRRARLTCWCQKPWREGEHVREQVTVR